MNPQIRKPLYVTYVSVCMDDILKSAIDTLVHIKGGLFFFKL